MKVTVVIPNYNGVKFLIPCIEALKKQTYKDYKLIVVDNNSSDASLEFLKKENIDCIELDKNYGFARACNVALEKVDTEYVILLNNDTVVFENYIENLAKRIEEDGNIFSVNPLMISMQDNNLVDDAGDSLNILGFAYQIGVGENIKYYQKKREVFSTCAGASIYRMSILKKIGFFDEKHFAYLEDVDLGFRARMFGYYNMYEPSAKVYHIGSATSGSRYNSFKVRLSARNNIYLHYKNLSNIMLVINFLPLCFGTLIKAMYFLKKGFLKDYISGIKEGLTTYKDTKRLEFDKIEFKNIFKLEAELVVSTFYYICHFFKRKLKR